MNAAHLANRQIKRARKLHVKFTRLEMAKAIAIKDHGVESHAVKNVEIHQAQVEGRIRQLNQPQQATL